MDRASEVLFVQYLMATLSAFEKASSGPLKDPHVHVQDYEAEMLENSKLGKLEFVDVMCRKTMKVLLPLVF